MYCPMLQLRDTDRYVKKFDCASEMGVREVRERRDLGVHQVPHRDLSHGRGSDEGGPIFLTLFFRFFRTFFFFLKKKIGKEGKKE